MSHSRTSAWKQSWGWTALLVSVGAVAVAYYVWHGAFEDIDATGRGDWRMAHHNWEAARTAILRHGEWPLWDPYHCGGVTAAGNPEVQSFSPLFLLLLFVGSTLALKVFLLLHAAAGFAGMYVLARYERRWGIAPSVLAAIAWAGCGFFAWHGWGGHATFLPFYLLPWAWLFWRRALVSPRWSAALAALLALVVLEGGTYPFPYMVLLLAFVGATDLVVGPGDRRRQVLRATLLTTPLVGLLSAVRALPVWETLRLFPRKLESTDYLEFGDVVAMLTQKEHDWQWGHEYVWAEYGLYVGWGVVVLAFVGFLLAVRDRRHDLLLGTAFFGLLMLGNRSSFHPWPVIHELLPVYDSLRVPSRFGVIFMFFVAQLAAFGVHRTYTAGRRLPLRRGAQLALTATVVVLSFALSKQVIDGNKRTRDVWPGAPIVNDEPVDEFRLVAGDYGWLAMNGPQRNEGTAQCYSGAMNWRIAPGLWQGDVPQVQIRPLPTRRAGGDGGRPFLVTCPAADWVTGFHYAMSSRDGAVGHLRLLCSSTSPQPRDSVGARLEPQAELVVAACAEGDGVTGILGQHHNFVSALAVNCRADRAQGKPLWANPVGHEEVSDFDLRCAEGQVATGVYGTAGALIDSIGLLCGSTGSERAVIHASGRTASTVWAEVSLAEPSLLVANQNYQPGWYTSIGELDPSADMLTVKLPAGRHHVSLTYSPPLFWWGLVLTLVGAVLTILVARFATSDNCALIWTRARRWLMHDTPGAGPDGGCGG